MNTKELFELIESASDKAFLHHDERNYTYGHLIEEMNRLNELHLKNFSAGTVISIEADFSLQSIALLLLSLKNKLICVPLLYNEAQGQKEKKITDAHVQVRFIADQNGFKIVTRENSAHPLISQLSEQKRAGIIIFSTGSTGSPKASLHDFEKQLFRFRSVKPPRTLVLFLFFDHFGGILTLFHVLTTAGRALVLKDHSPATVFEAIAKYKIEILPTSPTFLQLALISGCIKPRDLSSLKKISYGTEPMSKLTLTRLLKIFPEKKFLQTYGTTETGTLKIVNHPQKLNWFKIVDSDADYKIVDDILFIKSKLTMLGYLNAESPFDDEGYYNTQDRVLHEGQYMLVTGRQDDIINTGGQKVLPQEVEEVLRSIPGILDATVVGKPHPVVGQSVHAMVQVSDMFDLGDNKIKRFCAEKLSFYKVPLEFERHIQALPSSRNKKLRSPRK